MEEGTILFLCLENSHLDCICKSHITTLTITIAENKMIPLTLDTMNIVCNHVSTMFNSLTCLKFHPYSDLYIDCIERLSFESGEVTRFFSPNLKELHINVEKFTDCLYLLDGRFKQLHTLYVNVQYCTRPSSLIINKVDYLVEGNE
jgi:hypothetical protein